jgi:hypothetical protein
MNRLTIYALSLFLGLAGVSRACGDEGVPPVVATPSQEARPVDLVICLDASGSMSGLIDATRKKLWDVCTLLAQARPAPRLRVALYSFGGGEGAESRYIIQRAPLTEDLDKVYEALFALQATGSEELVGGVLQRAGAELDWSKDGKALRVIYVAGNESADQDGQHPFRKVAAGLRERGVVVNAVYCGADGHGGDAGTWREVAQHGGGAYTAIDQQGTLQIEAPQDAELVKLSQALNRTYVPFGAAGEESLRRQAAQDANAESCGSGAQRAAAKACGAVYRNDGWDLVDARKREGFDWAKLKDEELPEAIRGKTPAERDAWLKVLEAQRATIQAKIQALSAERQKFVDEETKRRQGESATSIDAALVGALKKQAEAKGFKFE